MKIDSDGLKAMYQDYVRRKVPSPKTRCPSPEKIVRLLRSGSSNKEATELIDHISRCSLCFSEFEFILDVLRHEKEFIRDVETGLADQGKPNHQKESGLKILGWRLGWRTLFPRFSWCGALIVAGLFFVGIFVTRSILFHPTEKYRAGSLTAVELVQPAGGRVSKAALFFKWKKVDRSEYYILELFDQALAPIWKSDKITEESAALSKELITSLEVNRPYFWTVTAYLNNGEKVPSRLEKFVLKE
jgi:hypothetical protein